MGPALELPPVVRGRRSRRPLEPGEPMGDEQRGAALGEGEQVVGQGVGGSGIEVLAPARRGRGRGTRPAGPGPRQTRWRWPPESAGPDGPTRVARPSGRPASHVPSPTRPSTAVELVVGGVAPADAQVLRQCGVEEVGVLLDQPDDSAHVVGGQPLQGDAVEGSSPASVGRKRTRTSARVDLPAPLGPDHGDAPSGAQLEIDAPQRGPAGAGVRRPDPAEGHRVRSRPGRSPVVAGSSDRHRWASSGGEDAARRRP